MIAPTAMESPPMEKDRRAGRKLNLLMAIEGLGVGGAEVVIQSLVQHIDRSRFNITICCLKTFGTIGEQLIRDGYDVVCLTEPGETRVNYFKFVRLRRLIRDRKIDVIHTHTTDALVDAAVCKLLLPRLRLLHTFHFGNYPHRRSRELWMERIASRVADRLYAVGEVQRQQLRAVYRYSDRTIRRIWNGVTFSSTGSSPVRAGRDAHGGRIIIGTIATMTEQKGLFDFLQVAQNVRRSRPDVHFVLVGAGPLQVALEARRQELQLEDTVSFPGWIQNAAHTELPKFDIFFQPSLWEAMSIALLEAMAAGKALVATRVGEAAHVIEAGIDGLLVEPKDIDGMTSALMRLIDDDELRSRLGNSAAQKARQQFTVEQMTRAYEAAYVDAM